MGGCCSCFDPPKFEGVDIPFEVYYQLSAFEKRALDTWSQSTLRFPKENNVYMVFQVKHLPRVREILNNQKQALLQ